jgi:hypothetical protein
MPTISADTISPDALAWPAIAMKKEKSTGSGLD